MTSSSSSSSKYKRISLTIPVEVYESVKSLRSRMIKESGSFSLSAFLAPHIEAAAIERLGGQAPKSKAPKQSLYTLDHFRDSRTEATPPLMSDTDVIHSFLGRLRDHHDDTRYDAVGTAIAAWRNAYHAVDKERLIASTSVVSSALKGPYGPSRDSSPSTGGAS